MSSGTPKYAMILNRIIREIQNGTYAVGDTLPTESELMTAYGVSRFTVRSALQELRNRGLIVSRQGQGSRVVSTGQHAALTEQIQSLDELIAFGQETRRKLLGYQIVTADEALAKQFECNPGRQLLQVEMLRYSLGDHPKPVAYLMLWMDALYEDIVDILEGQQSAVAEIMQERLQLSIGRVTQRASAQAMTREVAAVLDGKPGDAALCISRTYRVDAASPPHLLARSICPAGAVELLSEFEATVV